MIKTFIYGAVLAFFVVQTAAVPHVGLSNSPTTEVAAAH